jgi:hypothetical protein
MIKHIVTVTFRDDADPEIVKAFLAMAPDALARGPFRSVIHGSGVRVVPNGADWGFIADVDSEDDVRAWTKCEAHAEMVAYVRQISAGGANMQMVDPVATPIVRNDAAS